jgi:phosphate starvation-inducible PhoH-like protein
LKDQVTTELRRTRNAPTRGTKAKAVAVTPEPKVVKPIKHPVFRLIPRNHSQRDYVATIEANDLTFGLGPAGTGKTYIPVALAVRALKAKQVERIILIRPAVEAGERLGFLPGSMQDKVDPYMRPIYDALHEMLGREETEELIKKGTIEVAPLAFMRGRTLRGAFIIMDEGQNTTSEQMLMVLTRFGSESKVVVTGDLRQIDLPIKGKSGLIEAVRRLQGIEGIGFIHFADSDIVRHPLVQKIVHAYTDEDLTR